MHSRILCKVLSTLDKFNFVAFNGSFFFSSILGENNIIESGFNQEFIVVSGFEN